MVGATAPQRDHWAPITGHTDDLPYALHGGDRTAARAIDHTIIGLLVMVLTGRPRQRIGDLVAGTVVVDARFAPAVRPLGPRQLWFPAICMLPALLNFFAYADGRAGGSYRAQADAVCAEATALSTEARGVVARADSARDPAAAAARGLERLGDHSREADARVAANGFRECAGEGLVEPAPAAAPA